MAHIIQLDRFKFNPYFNIYDHFKRDLLKIQIVNV